LAAAAAESVELGKNIGKKPAIIVSRSNLSRARPQAERAKLLADKTVHFGNKGYFGTPLPLIPDIRKSEVSDGVIGILLEALGVAKKFDQRVTLHQGPNKRLNRYLVFQYKRLIKSIGGTTVKGNNITPAHTVWPYNFYELSNPRGKVLLTSKERKELRGKVRIY
jgi:hypothetical protein